MRTAVGADVVTTTKSAAIVDDLSVQSTPLHENLKPGANVMITVFGNFNRFSEARLTGWWTWKE
jgi:hypothetical protein